MLKIGESKWVKYGGWIFVIPWILQLIWDSINGQHTLTIDFIEGYWFGGFMAVVALFCAGKLGSR